MTFAYTIWHNHRTTCPQSNSLGPLPPIYTPKPFGTSIQQSYGSPPSISHTFVWTFNEHNVYPHQMCSLHIPLSSCHSGLARALASGTTSKLKGCGLPRGAFNLLLLDVLPSVDLGVPPQPNSPSCGGSGSAFSSSAIVAKIKHFCA
jgi:hypothetical protein